MPRPTQQFSGKTLEAAVLAAIDELGESAEILEAKRMRRGGIGGFFASESYVVTARANDRHVTGAPLRVSVVGQHEPAPSSPATDPVAAPPGQTEFQSHLHRLIAAAEAKQHESEHREQMMAEHAARPTFAAGINTTDLPRFFTDEDLRPLPVAQETIVTPAWTDAIVEAAAGHRHEPVVLAPRVAVAEPVVVGARLEPAFAAAEPRIPEYASAGVGGGGTGFPPPPPGPPATPRPAPPNGIGPDGVIDLRSTDPQWSLDHLRALGLPEAVLVEVSEAEGDMAWTAAVEHAIRTIVPPPADLRDPSVTLVVNGNGAHSVARMIQAALNGYPLGELLLGGRRVPATSVELTLAIRSCLPS